LPQVNVLLEGCLVDFFWPRECVIVETDGYIFHRDRPAFERDHEQTAALEAEDYLVHRATYCMLASDPVPFMRLVRRSLRRRRDHERLAGAGAP
jgi:very-short-patch-repair endonuclease